MRLGLNILVVDDEAIVRTSLLRLLTHAGHFVDLAGSGEAALALLDEKPFDLVITDFSMPGMKGDQLVARIRERWPAQPIVMSTAFVDEYKVFGQPAGTVDALVLKPFTLGELLEAIDVALASRAAVPFDPPREGDEDAPRRRPAP